MRDIILTALAPLSWGTTCFVTTQLLPPNRTLFVELLRRYRSSPRRDGRGHLVYSRASVDVERQAKACHKTEVFGISWQVVSMHLH